MHSLPSTGFSLRYNPIPALLVWANTKIGYVWICIFSNWFPKKYPGRVPFITKQLHWLGGSPHPQWAASSPCSKLSMRYLCWASHSMGVLSAVLPHSTYPIATFCSNSHRPGPAAGTARAASNPRRIKGGTCLMPLNAWLRFQRHAGMGSSWAPSVFPVSSTATGLS